MNTTLEYIESYFQQTLNPEERKLFEARCEQDEAFAQEVAFYVTTRQALREELVAQKQVQWKEEKNAEEEKHTEEEKSIEEELPSLARAKRSVLRTWGAYAAAACLVLAASVYLFEATSSPRKLAGVYIEKNYSQISQEMGNDLKDSMTLGISAYNDKEYDKALQMFTGIEQRDPNDSYAKEYAGLAYLQQKNYNQALQQFDALANMKGLHSNPGDFLKAVALLERNNPGDKEEARKLLQEVKDKNEDGSKEAEEWLKKF